MASDRPEEVSKEQREFSRRRFLRNAGVATAAYGGLAAILTEQGASAATYRRNSDNAVFASHPAYKFVMVNHVTTNPFFTATIYGCQDACALTGTKFQWTDVLIVAAWGLGGLLLGIRYFTWEPRTAA